MPAATGVGSPTTVQAAHEFVPTRSCKRIGMVVCLPKNHCSRILRSDSVRIRVVGMWKGMGGSHVSVVVARRSLTCNRGEGR
uniref:Uncharacterized protein n=1 Tax=Hyaloperonospora arabidopsidis (strain Emoy2) TaxID=559515 RepID=M4C4D0_HYAAE